MTRRRGGVLTALLPGGGRVKQYFRRKLVIYLLTFFIAVTIDWLIPRFMPGDPVQNMLSRANLRAEAAEVMYGYYTDAFGLDVPIWQQYLNFWNALFHGDLGTSVYMFPTPVTKAIMRAVPYDILLAGLDRQLIINYKEEREKITGYPGLRVGSLVEATNNAGNWE